MEKKRNEITISDIAEIAHVSKSTVSRYMNGSGYVSDETALVISQAMRMCDYRPNPYARSLRTNRSNVIFVVVPDISNPFYAKIVRNVQILAKAGNFMVMLYNTNEEIGEAIHAIRTAQEIQVACLFLWSIHTKNVKLMEALERANIQVVLANFYEGIPFDLVHANKNQSTYLTTNHLIDLGHRHIAFVGGPTESSVSTGRKRGYMLALQEHGFEFNEDDCFEMGFSKEAGYKFGRYFLALDHRPTAVCCANDLIALGVMQFFREHGISIPNDVSITGIDNIDYNGIDSLKLTTVDLNIEETTQQMMDLFLSRYSGAYRGEPREVRIDRHIVIGNSTAPAPSGAEADG